MMGKWNNIIAISTIILALLFLFHKNIRTLRLWHATVTPLASIIGSGFLVSAPLLLLTAGQWALPIMIIIVLLAYAVGSSMRFNIQHVEPLLENQSKSPWVARIETISHPILSIAYVISVTFYLKLLSAFALQGMGLNSTVYENTLTTILLLSIGITGKVRGLFTLEIMEIYSVNIKLAIIFGLLVTLIALNTEFILQGEWVVKAYSHDSWWVGFRKVLGMLIIVQGFETSRYLGQVYSTSIRVKTMQYAQWISGAIYILFVALAMIVFNDIQEITETSIIDLSNIVAPVLPFILIIAAIMSQFSAAIADTIGSGGLIAEATHKKVSTDNAYIIITSIAIILTWSTNIYEIISIASKGFAIYYACQIILTLLAIRQNQQLKFRTGKILFYGLLFLLMLMIIVFGIPAE
jgi:hypothetical protein